MQEAEIDGECFIGMDLVDINGLTAKMKLRKLLRLAWTEVTGMVTMLAHLLRLLYTLLIVHIFLLYLSLGDISAYALLFNPS